MPYANPLKRAHSLLLDILRARPEGLSEHQLIKLLNTEYGSELTAGAFDDNLSLFRAHFLLFHALYTLREQLWAKRSGHLEITALKIALQPYRPGQGEALAERDPLRDYYLDLTHLDTTSAEDVEAMLRGFWTRFVTTDDRHEALTVLELDDTTDFTVIKRQYRRLAMRHHPDRGGDKDALQRLNSAMDVLTRYHGKGK